MLLIGPVLARDGGFAFDTWTALKGLAGGPVYRRIEDAYYARKVALDPSRSGQPGHPIECGTLDELNAMIARRAMPAAA